MIDSLLLDEKDHKISDGIYHRIQIDLAYNSDRMEGNCLTYEQVKALFDTGTISDESARVDDIIETVNHFRCFDHILDTLDEPLSEGYIKELHRMLKTGTLSSRSEEAVIGEYKKYANEVGDVKTALPEEVHDQMVSLLDEYNGLSDVTLEDIVSFHVRFEKIHPFYDGNGRIGRLIMVRECLKNKITPFVISDNEKIFYYMGLKEWQTEDKHQRLMSLCELSQMDMEKILEYFGISS